MNSLLDLIGLPEVERQVYANPPLRKVICQVRYSPEAIVSDRAVVGRFQRTIKSKYPVMTQAPKIDFSFQLGHMDGTFNQMQIWQFSDRDDNWKIALTEDFLALDTASYADFEDFLTRLKEALGALKKHISPSLILRIGLRYINEIRSDSGDWAKIVNPDLLGPASSHLLTANTDSVQSVQRLQLNYAGGLGINLVHGVFPNGTTVGIVAEADPESPFYLLDYDVFREFDGEANMDIDQVVDEVETFNQVIYRLFRWSVLPEYVSGLQVREKNG